MSQSSLPLILNGNNQQILGWLDRNPTSDSRRSSEEVSKDIISIPSCDNDCLHGLQIFASEGSVKSELCSCASDLPQDVKFELIRRGGSVANSGIAPLFANSLYGKLTFDAVAPPKIKEWLDKACDVTGLGDHVFLCGNVGTGKTHLANDCLKRFIIKTGNEAYYTTATFVVEIKANAVASNFSRARNYEPEEIGRLKHLERISKHAGMIIIDEIRESLNKTGVCFLEELIDKRYASGLPTVFISNHTFDAETSYKRLTIQKVLGDRNGDRLRNAIVCEFNGHSKRGLRHPDTITEEERGEFCFPPSVLALEDNKRQILNLMTRNQIFEPIHRANRSIATDAEGNPVTSAGVAVDVERKNSKTRDGAWQKGDKLVLKGPVLCRYDARTYVTCLHLLKQQHRKKKYGLDIRIAPTHLMRALELNQSSLTSREALHRSLRRITAANFEYRDSRGREWTGPLFYFRYEPNNHEGAYLIHFNKSMLVFYESCEYTVLPKKIFDIKAIGTEGLRMQMFLRSHAVKTHNNISFMGWMRILGRPTEKMDCSTPADRLFIRECRKKFSETIRKQVKAGLLTSNSGLFRDDSVIANLTPDDQIR